MFHVSRMKYRQVFGQPLSGRPENRMADRGLTRGVPAPGLVGDGAEEADSQTDRKEQPHDAKADR